MATKNAPGKYDCYSSAHPNEPLFTLLGRDPDAPLLVRIWALLREKRGEDSDKVQEALQCAKDMESWCEKDVTTVEELAKALFGRLYQ